MSYCKSNFLTRIFHHSFILCDLKSFIQQRTHYLCHLPIFFLFVNLYLLMIFLCACIFFEIWILGHWDCDVASAQLHFIFFWKAGNRKKNGSVWTTKIICYSFNICPKSLLKILVSLKDYLRGFVIACISLNWDFIFADHVCFKCIHSGSISVTYWWL